MKIMKIINAPRASGRSLCCAWIIMHAERGLAIHTIRRVNSTWKWAVWRNRGALALSRNQLHNTDGRGKESSEGYRGTRQIESFARTTMQIHQNRKFHEWNWLSAFVYDRSTAKWAFSNFRLISSFGIEKRGQARNSEIRVNEGDPEARLRRRKIITFAPFQPLLDSDTSMRAIVTRGLCKSLGSASRGKRNPRANAETRISIKPNKKRLR